MFDLVLGLVNIFAFYKLVDLIFIKKFWCFMESLKKEIETVLTALAGKKKFNREDWEIMLLAQLMEEDGHEAERTH